MRRLGATGRETTEGWHSGGQRRFKSGHLKPSAGVTQTVNLAILAT